MAKRKIYDMPVRNPEDDPFREIREAARAKVVREAQQRTMVPDPSLDIEIARRVDALGEPYKTEFYRMREQAIVSRRDDEPLSQQDIDLMNLSALERSAAFREGK